MGQVPTGNSDFPKPQPAIRHCPPVPTAVTMKSQLTSSASLKPAWVCLCETSTRQESLVWHTFSLPSCWRAECHHPTRGVSIYLWLCEHWTYVSEINWPYEYRSISEFSGTLNLCVYVSVKTIRSCLLYRQIDKQANDRYKDRYLEK